jgi:hypothetical protein
MIRALRWIGELGYHASVMILIVMLLFTTSVSALRLHEDPKPLTHFKVGSELWQQKPPKREEQGVVESWSIHHELGPINRERYYSDSLNRNPPLRL